MLWSEDAPASLSLSHENASTKQLYLQKDNALEDLFIALSILTSLTRSSRWAVLFTL